MKCSNCGFDNNDNTKFCQHCGNLLKKSGLSKKIKILIAVICLVFAGIISILLKNYVFNEPTLKSIYIDGNYTKDGTTYIFDLSDDYVLITPEMNFKLGGVDIDKQVEDLSVANCTTYSNSIKLIFNSVGKSKLTIYGDGKILSIIEFEVRDNSNVHSIKNQQTNNAQNNNTSTDNAQVEKQEIQRMMNEYFTGYQLAVNYGDFNQVSPYMDSNGPAYNDTRDSILDTYNRGTTLSLIGCQMMNIQSNSSGGFVASYQVKWYINSSKSGGRYQTEAADFTIHKKNGSYVVYKMDNWRLISKS